MDISPFLFVSEVDKKHFFGMYEEYLTSMSELGTEVVYDKYGDITVLMRDKIVCTFYISDDYKTMCFIHEIYQTSLLDIYVFSHWYLKFE